MFSGIEAASQAFPQWNAIAFAEIEKFPSAVLAHHYPDVPNVGDMTAHDWSQYHGKADIVCGGPPCQAFSVAGLRNSLQDARGNLSLSYMRALHAIKPRNAIVENVPGWLNTPDNAFGCFLAGLVGADAPLISPLKRGRWPDAGMVAGPEGRAAWRILDAQYFGLAQRRRRVIVVADFGNGADPAAVLFEPEGVCRYSPPSREAGKGTSTYSASSIGCYRDAEVSGAVRAAGGDNGGGSEKLVAATLTATYGEQSGQDMMAENMLVFAPEIARCDATREGSSRDYESTTMVAVGVTGDIAHTLKAEGADASEDGTGRGTPIVCVHGTQDPCTSESTAFALGRNSGGENVIAFTAKDYGGDAQVNLSPTLRAGGHSGSHANAGVMPAVTVAIRGREGGATAELGGPIATALRASQGGGDKPHVLYAPETYPTLSASEGGTLTQVPPVVTSAVRRLTPVECERLMGFPDNYTAIPWRGKHTSPDGPRYKALGNSWAVPLFAWLGKRIDAHMPPLAANDNKDTARAAA
ncbi:DNA cytosine methyltransferase [Pseudaminobacter arsenicus]|uniref:DNA (cytosine-5-)-methyltransferase n=2 Tax=Borborobacter arsenicus TaxID=1851146 RepID=A0A432VAM1_9HYPH|nr:DNA cytosine methyltransferase [Pseudaminobacter arsenicus]